jgi:hypothetical protein
VIAREARAYAPTVSTINRRSLEWTLKWYGRKSRPERYVPPPRGDTADDAVAGP